MIFYCYNDLLVIFVYLCTYVYTMVLENNSIFSERSITLHRHCFVYISFIDNNHNSAITLDILSISFHKGLMCGFGYLFIYLFILFVLCNMKYLTVYLHGSTGQQLRKGSFPV